MLPTDIELAAGPRRPGGPPGRHARPIVSVVHPRLSDDEYTGGLWTVPLDGDGAPRRLTRGHRDTAPDVSPDGRWVAFLRAEPQGKPQVHVVEAAGGEPVRLTDAPLGASSPRFSPDGTRIAYLARVPEPGRYEPDGRAGLGAAAAHHRAAVPRRRRGLRARPPAAPVRGRPARGRHERGDDAADVRRADQRRHRGRRRALAALGRRAGRGQRAARRAARPTCGRTRSWSTLTRRASPHAPVPLTDADAGSTLGVEAVLPSADGASVWLLASDLGPSRSGLRRRAGRALPGRARRRAGAGGAADRPGERRPADQRPGGARGGRARGRRESRGAVHLAAGEPRTAPRARSSTARSSSRARPWVAARVVVTAATPTSAGDVLVVDPAPAAATPGRTSRRRCARRGACGRRSSSRHGRPTGTRCTAGWCARTAPGRTRPS